MESLFIAIWKGLKSMVAWVTKPLRTRPRILRWMLFGVVTVVLLIIAFVGMVWVGVFGRVPDHTDLSAINNQVATEVYSADSVLLGRYYLQERSPVHPAQIPEGLRNALISTEDARF